MENQIEIEFNVVRAGSTLCGQSDGNEHGT